MSKLYVVICCQVSDDGEISSDYIGSGSLDECVIIGRKEITERGLTLDNDQFETENKCCYIEHDDGDMVCEIHEVK